MTGQALPKKYYALPFLSICFNAVQIHCTKAALGDSTPLLVASLACTSGVFCFLLAGFICRCMGVTWANLHTVTVRSMVTYTASKWPLALLGSVMGFGSGWIINYSFSQYDPAFVAFLINLTVVFLVIAGVLSGERVGWGEGVTIGMIIAGAFIYSYRGGDFQWQALFLVSLGCVFVAIKNMSVKWATTRENLTLYMPGYLVLTVLCFLLGGYFSGQLHVPSVRVVILASVAGFFGSFFCMLLLYSSFHLLGVSRTAPINTLRPVAVLLLGLALGVSEMPTLLQLGGAVLILSGSVFLTRLHSQARRPALVEEQDGDGATGGL